LFLLEAFSAQNVPNITFGCLGSLAQTLAGLRQPTSKGRGMGREWKGRGEESGREREGQRAPFYES